MHGRIFIRKRRIPTCSIQFRYAITHCKYRVTLRIIYHSLIRMKDFLYWKKRKNQCNIPLWTRASIKLSIFVIYIHIYIHIYWLVYDWRQWTECPMIDLCRRRSNLVQNNIDIKTPVTNSVRTCAGFVANSRMNR